MLKFFKKVFSAISRPSKPTKKPRMSSPQVVHAGEGYFYIGEDGSKRYSGKTLVERRDTPDISGSTKPTRDPDGYRNTAANAQVSGVFGPDIH